MKETMIDDFKGAASSHLGRCAIQYRNKWHNAELHPSDIGAWFALNSFGDSWFRCWDKMQNCFQHGLKVRELRVRSEKTIRWGSGRCIKCMMLVEFSLTCYNNVTEWEPAWLYLEDGIDLQDVMVQIENNSTQWVD